MNSKLHDALCWKINRSNPNALAVWRLRSPRHFHVAHPNGPGHCSFGHNSNKHPEHVLLCGLPCLHKKLHHTTAHPGENAGWTRQNARPSRLATDLAHWHSPGASKCWGSQIPQSHWHHFSETHYQDFPRCPTNNMDYHQPEASAPPLRQWQLFLQGLGGFLMPRCLSQLSARLQALHILHWPFASSGPSTRTPFRAKDLQLNYGHGTGPWQSLVELCETCRHQTTQRSVGPKQTWRHHTLSFWLAAWSVPSLLWLKFCLVSATWCNIAMSKINLKLGAMLPKSQIPKFVKPHVVIWNKTWISSVESKWRSFRAPTLKIWHWASWHTK